MNDISDIQTYIFGFFYSLNYFIVLAMIVFFVLFYLVLQYYFDNIKVKNEISAKIDTIDDDALKTRFHYILEHARSLERTLFYREVSVFLKFVISREKNTPEIFYMTLQEIKSKIHHPYNPLLEEVYYLEFDKNSVDNLEKRYEILKKIEV